MSSKVRLLMLTLALVVAALFASAAHDTQAACARCGDGVCARSCENEFSCPKDCAPQPY